MLEYESREEGSGSGMPGVAVSTGKINEVLDMSKQPHPSIGKVFDCCVAFRLDIGRSFSPQYFVFGDFKRNTEGKATEFGAAFKVGRLFDKAGIKLVIGENERIPEDLLNSLLGKEISILRFVSGTKKDKPDEPRWVPWDMVGDPGADGEAALVKLFKYKLGKDKYLRKKFTPNVSANGDTDFDPEKLEASAEPDAAQSADEDSF